MSPRVLIVSPALPDANNGNAHTAARWQRFLSEGARVDVALGWDPRRDADVDALIALHACRSGASAVAFAAAHPRRPLAVVLTGTDLYRDLPAGHSLGERALECASHLVVLQPQALCALAPALRAKARVVLQSALAVVQARAAPPPWRLVAVGHLRPEKDPLTLLAALRLLPREAPLALEHVGRALDPALGEAARRTAAEVPAYRWSGELPAAAARERIAQAHALVHPSRMEGGANVVIEAVRSGVPVLASRIDGNVGLLGPDYGGYFPAGDAPALAALLLRFVREPALAARLQAQCAALAPAYAPEAEAAAVRALLAAMLDRGGVEPACAGRPAGPA